MSNYFSSCCLLALTVLSLMGCEQEPNISQEKLGQKHIENAEQFKEALIHEAAKAVPAQDSVYLIMHRGHYICGNDEAFDGITTKAEEEAEQAYIRQNPYYVDMETYAATIYKINDKVVVPGISFDNDFISEVAEFEYDQKKYHKHMYDIHLEDVKADTIQASIIDWFGENGFTANMVFVRKNNVWQRL